MVRAFAAIAVLLGFGGVASACPVAVQSFGVCHAQVAVAAVPQVAVQTFVPVQVQAVQVQAVPFVQTFAAPVVIQQAHVQNVRVRQQVVRSRSVVRVRSR